MRATPFLVLLLAAITGCAGDPFAPRPTIPPEIEGAFAIGTYRQIEYDGVPMPTGFAPATLNAFLDEDLAADSGSLVIRPGVVIIALYQRQLRSDGTTLAFGGQYAEPIARWTATGFHTSVPDPGPCGGGFDGGCINYGSRYDLELRGDTLIATIEGFVFTRRHRYVRTAP